MGFTQQKVADILGIKRSTYGYYEIDICPPISILKKLANMYNVSIDEITGEYPDVRASELKLKAGEPEGGAGMPTLPQLNADENELLMLYRLLPQELKQQVKKNISALADKQGD
jgi:transcriptional regulator with XRE-family HTH domain